MRALAVILTAGAFAAGCGGSSSNGVASKSPADIVKATEQAATSASAVHVTGTIVNGDSKLTIDLRFVGTAHATGHISEQGVGFDVVRIGDRVYIRGSKAFYAKFAGSAAAALLQGKWLFGSATSGDFSSFEPLTDLGSFFSELLKSHGKLAKGAETTIDGQKAIGLEDTSASGGGTLYVATTGKPYPVELKSPGGGKEGTVTFGDWNKKVTVTAPKSALDLKKLESGG